MRRGLKLMQTNQFYTREDFSETISDAISVQLPITPIVESAARKRIAIRDIEAYIGHKNNDEGAFGMAQTESVANQINRGLLLNLDEHVSVGDVEEVARVSQEEQQLCDAEYELCREQQHQRQQSYISEDVAALTIAWNSPSELPTSVTSRHGITYRPYDLQSMHLDYAIVKDMVYLYSSLQDATYVQDGVRVFNSNFYDNLRSQIDSGQPLVLKNAATYSLVSVEPSSKLITYYEISKTASDPLVRPDSSSFLNNVKKMSEQLSQTNDWASSISRTISYEGSINGAVASLYICDKLARFDPVENSNLNENICVKLRKQMAVNVVSSRPTKILPLVLDHPILTDIVQEAEQHVGSQSSVEIIDPAVKDNRTTHQVEFRHAVTYIVFLCIGQVQKFARLASPSLHFFPIGNATTVTVQAFPISESILGNPLNPAEEIHRPHTFTEPMDILSSVSAVTGLAATSFPKEDCQSSTTMEVLPSEASDVAMEDSDEALNIQKIDSQKISLFVDILPTLRVWSKREFQWLHENAQIVRSEADRSEKEESKEWIRRFKLFKSSVNQLNDLYRLVIESPNKSLVQEIFHMFGRLKEYSPF
uniref:Uncharacterized protein n=1 Tax=Ditylenchus dipsaci TaxID=166011 RepID=A0A915DCL7_9BILA